MSTVKVYQFPEINPELNNMFPLNPRDRLVQRQLSYRGVPYTINMMLPTDHPTVKKLNRDSF